MTIHTIKGSEANEESFQEIVSKLDNYKTLASNHGVQIKETSIHSTHGILYCTLDFKKMEEHNIIELLGLDSDYIIKDKNDFYKLISKKYFSHKPDQYNEHLLRQLCSNLNITFQYSLIMK